MNVDLIGRLRPLVVGDTVTGSNLEVDGSQRLINKLAGNSFTFQQLYKSPSSNFDIYRSSVDSLVQLFVAGYNTSLVVTGCQGSGKSHSVAGSGSVNPGLVSLILQHVFSKIDPEGALDGRQTFNGTARARMSPALHIQAYDVVNETVNDLLASVTLSDVQKPEVKETAEKGTHVMNLTSVQVTGSTSGQSLFQQIWGIHNPQATTFIHLELSMLMPETVAPTKSQFTFVVFPFNSVPQASLNYMPAGTQVKEAAATGSSKTTIALMQLVASLANQPYADRVIRYSESVVTQLLQDQLGGNCKTRVLMCFSPSSDPSSTSVLFQFADSLSKVKNFPVPNDSFAQQLHTQFRATILGLHRQLDPRTVGLHSSHDYEQIKNIQSENVMLRDASERLQAKINELQDRYSALAASKTDLSTQLLMTEEEKLKVSKTLVDMQIENNRLREECEASKFEMTNKILQMEIAVSDSEEEKKRLATVIANTKDKMEEVEKARKDMADELLRWKTNTIDLKNAHQKEVERNDHLSMELLKVVNAQLAAMEQSESAARERDRIRTMISQLADRPAESQKLDEENQSPDKPVFEAMNKLQQILDQERTEYEKEREILHAKVADLRAELNEARHQTRETQSKLSELNAQLITARSDKTALESQINRVQHKLKDINDDFKSRLVKYVKDIAGYIDTVERRISDDGSTPARMAQYVEDMLDDLRRSHRIREEQLSSAANSYRQRIEQVVRRHEELLVAYRDLRQQVEARGLTEVELGPDEHKLSLRSELELASSQQREIERLRDDLIRKQADIDALKLRTRVGQYGKDNAEKYTKDDRTDAKEPQKTIREYSVELQKDLEQERARLLGQNVMLEEEVKELQNYIDIHLSRYKDEILRLRQIIQQLSLAAKLSSDDRPLYDVGMLNSRKNQHH